ncbi:PREDICTED: U-box domain-containing protein 38-like [Nelumbo nucifera]|uniref:RING-type E3 ubiquitin transferase n=1 Tax=Nelumbo nucifera TaxID=4432 RepID=A0A1U7ZNX0_NELNU|nr:PREDICTED: U-box domain-containing protein 38-like [Nelumbo nucifera]XP_010255033.1 PREDICTED: U-box domain-containing protein 38-like [Nelumbo nucifera]
MGSGRHKWFSFRSSSGISKAEMKQFPKEFVCPISESLMADPVIVASGQTFERNCVQACKNLGFTPILSDGSKPDFSTVIPNIALKSTILKWCDTSGVECPKPMEHGSAEKFVRALIASQDEKSRSKNNKEDEEKEEDAKLGASEKELLKGIAENPPVKFTHAETEVNRRRTHFYTSSESEESVTTTNPSTPLPLATRPSCYSSSSSSEIIADDETPNTNSSEEDEFIFKLRSCQVFEQEEAVISLRKVTRTQEEIRNTLCTPRLLSALRPLLVSRYSAIQINAVAALVNLSLEKMNKVKIVRSGIVPPLIDVLKGGFAEAQEHAAGALFSLALEDDNKMAIGVLGALQPLLHMLRSESQRARHDSALALYHLSLVQSNRTKLVKMGSIPTLLALASTGDLASRALLILCNLAVCMEGRTAMLDANAVECFVGMLRRHELESEATRENCVAALYALSQGSLRFKGLAKEAGAMEVLREVEDRGSERAREKAKRMLQMMRGRDEEEDEEVDWEDVLELGVTSRARHRFGGYANNESGSISTTF